MKSLCHGVCQRVKDLGGVVLNPLVLIHGGPGTSQEPCVPICGEVGWYNKSSTQVEIIAFCTTSAAMPFRQITLGHLVYSFTMVNKPFTMVNRSANFSLASGSGSIRPRYMLENLHQAWEFSLL